MAYGYAPVDWRQSNPNLFSRNPWFRPALDKFQGAFNVAEQQPFSDANAYGTALAKSEFGNAGRAYAQGLGGLQGYLSTQGPLGDSGARAALGARLASNIYGAAQSRIGQGYASYLAQALAARRAYNYQYALLKAQHAMQQTGVGGFLGGVAGSFGGPLLGAAGTYLGNKWAGG